MNFAIKHPVLAALPSSFSVEAFGGGSFEGQGDTRRLQLEEKEYPAIIVGPWGEDRKTHLRTTDKGHLILDVVWQPDDPEQKSKLKIEKLPTLRQSIFLDLTDNGALDMGPFKNPDLNRLREVFGLNAPGQKWSFTDFIGRVATIKLENRPNKDDPANPYQNVTAVKK